MLKELKNKISGVLPWRCRGCGIWLLPMAMSCSNCGYKRIDFINTELQILNKYVHPLEQHFKKGTIITTSNGKFKVIKVLNTNTVLLQPISNLSVARRLLKTLAPLIPWSA